MNTYTVVALYPDAGGPARDDSFVEAFKAARPSLAAAKCRERMARETKDAPADVQIIAVFEGDHKDVYEPSVQSAAA